MDGFDARILLPVARRCSPRNSHVKMELRRLEWLIVRKRGGIQDVDSRGSRQRR